MIFIYIMQSDEVALTTEPCMSVYSSYILSYQKCFSQHTLRYLFHHTPRDNLYLNKKRIHTNQKCFIHHIEARFSISYQIPYIIYHTPRDWIIYI